MADTLISAITGVLSSVRMKPAKAGTDDPQWTWTSEKGGKYYVYLITVKDEHGKVWEGEVSGSKPFNYSVPQGSTITTEVYSNENSHNGTKFKGLKAINKPDTPNKSSYNDPDNNMKMAYSLARTNTINTYKLLLKQPSSMEAFDGVVNLYFNWITKDKTITDRNILSRRWYVLQDAVNGIEVWAYQTTAEIINKAEEFIQNENSI